MVIREMKPMKLYEVSGQKLQHPSSPAHRVDRHGRYMIGKVAPFYSMLIKHRSLVNAVS